MFVTPEYIMAFIFAISFPRYLSHIILLLVYLTEVTVAVWETIIKGMQEAPAGSAASHNRTVHYQPLSSASQNFPISRRWAVGEQTAGAVAATLCSLQLHSGGCSTGKSAAF